MTTTVHIAVSGNKAVQIETPGLKHIVQPGGHITVSIHGDQKIVASEIGDFVNHPVRMIETIAMTGSPEKD